MAMLMTPARSQRHPASAPNTNGVAIRIVPGIGFAIAAEKPSPWSA